MLNTLFALFLSTGMPVVPAPSPIVADTVHCRITAVADVKSRRCSVAIPNGRVIRPCGKADASAKRCDKRAERRFTMWVVESNAAQCKISRKHSDWTKHVVVRMTEKTPVGAAACDLYVVLR